MISLSFKINYVDIMFLTKINQIYDAYHDLFDTSKSMQYNLKDMIILNFYM